jgi:hypothetical protein
MTFTDDKYFGLVLYINWGWRGIEQYTESGKPRVLKSQPFTQLHPEASVFQLIFFSQLRQQNLGWQYLKDTIYELKETLRERT